MRSAAAVLAAAAGAVALTCVSGAATAAPASHVVLIVMENKESGDILGSPAAAYENSLARRYGLATRSYAITHPSLPNYLALTSGSTQGITSDCTGCSVNGANIVDQLAGAGISWKAYLQGVPGTCYGGADAGRYAKRHNPFAYYADISRSRSRCRNLVGFGALNADLKSGRLPTFAWISPDVCNDTHDCGVATGDAFLSHLVPSLLAAVGPSGFVVITWDEGTSSAGCCGGAASGGHVATIVAGPGVIAGGRERAAVDHYGVLATVERALGLPPSGAAADPRNGSLAPLFRSPPRVR